MLPNILKKKKLIATVLDKNEVILVDTLQRDTTVNAAVYTETLKKLRRTIQNQQREMLTSDFKKC